MKKYIFLVIFCLSSCGMTPVYALDITRIEGSLAFAPPHNEPVVLNYVARYKAEIDLEINHKIFWVELNQKIWGLQDWRTPELVGHGFPTAWQGSDWSVKNLMLDFTGKYGITVYRPFQIYVEQNLTKNIGINQGTLSSNYYWLIGIRIK